jgi:hypothetical protein
MFVVDVFPGRCPGLICDCPFGATTQKAQHQNVRSRVLCEEDLKLLRAHGHTGRHWQLTARP